MTEERRAPGHWWQSLWDLASGRLPLVLRELQSELDERLRKVPNRLNEYGFDPFGLSPDWVRNTALPGLILYRYYFRVETHDIDRMPPGRVLLIANHAGQLPFDGMMLQTALLLEADPPRIVRAMGEYWIPQLPLVSFAAARTGAMVGTPHNCAQMLHHGECVAAFPEGVRGMNKRFRDRYRLQRFGLGFMRLALETHTPIVPVAIVGSEEQQPGFANLSGVASAVGMPALPITLGFPWLGPLGLLPMPVKYRIYFGEPIFFEGGADEEDAAIQERVDVVKREITAMLERGVAQRSGIFR
jgi:1-acyl-sn-glycerol-3-phosphate acyltransferase